MTPFQESLGCVFVQIIIIFAKVLMKAPYQEH